MPIFKKIPKFNIPKGRKLANWGTVSREVAAGFQDYLDNIVVDFDLLGLQLSLKTSRGEIWNGAGGTLDLARNVSLTTDHVMRIGSVTKVFTSVVIHHLAETGVLALMDCVDKWLPNFPRGDRITLWMLLSHCSGIDDPPFTIPLKLRMLLSKRPFDLKELIALGAGTPSWDERGNSYRYSNTNHHLLGFIAEAATGMTIVDLYDEVIFKRMELTRTALLPNQAPPANLVEGFDNVYTPSIRMLQVKQDNVMIASHGNTAGGMASTAQELLTFIVGLFDGKLLSQKTVRQLSDVKVCSDPQFHHTGYGPGLFRFRIGDIEYLGHFGQFVGFQAIVLYQLEKMTAISAIGNLSNSRIFQVIRRFQDAVIAEE